MPTALNFFFVHAPLSSNLPCFERQISKTRRYTNVVCCELETLHLEPLPHPAAQVQSQCFQGASADGYTVRTFFPFFLSFFPLSLFLSHALVWPLELVLQGRFVIQCSLLGGLGGCPI